MSLLSLVQSKLIEDKVRDLKEDYDAINFLQWHHQTFHGSPSSSVDIPTAYGSFKNYCATNNHEVPSWQTFSKLMAKHSKKQRTSDGKMQFTGIGINNHYLNLKEDLDEGKSIPYAVVKPKTSNEAKQKWSPILDDLSEDPKEKKKYPLGLLAKRAQNRLRTEDISEEEEICEGIISSLRKTYKVGKSLRDRYLSHKNKVFHTVFYRHGGFDDGESFNSGEWFIHSHHENHQHAKTASDFLKQFDVEKVRTLPLNKEQLRSAYDNPHSFMTNLEGQLGHQKTKREVVKLGSEDSLKEWHRINKDKLEMTPSTAGKWSHYKNWAKTHGHDSVDHSRFEEHLKQHNLTYNGDYNQVRKSMGLDTPAATSHDTISWWHKKK